MIEPFGKNLKIKIISKSKNKKHLSEKVTFIDIMELFDFCVQRTTDMSEKYYAVLTDYDEPFYVMIENLICLKYEEWETEIILWWVYHRFDQNGNLLPIEYSNPKTPLEQIFINTPTELWNFLKKIKNNDKN